MSTPILPGDYGHHPPGSSHADSSKTACNRCYHELNALRQDITRMQIEYTKLVAAHDSITTNVNTIGSSDRMHETAIQSLVSRVGHVEIELSSIKSDHAGLSTQFTKNSTKLAVLVRGLVEKYQDIRTHGNQLSSRVDESCHDFSMFQLDFAKRNAELASFEEIVKNHLDKTDGVCSADLGKFKAETANTIELLKKEIADLKTKNSEEEGAKKRSLNINMWLSTASAIAAGFAGVAALMH